MPAIRLNVIVRDSGVLDRLEHVSTVSVPEETENAFEDILTSSIQEARQYPPETSANQPPPPYYIRGVGYVGRSGFVTKVSEDLKSQWGMDVTTSGNTTTGMVTNLASYAKYVHNEQGDPEPPWQTSFHARTGWQTIQSIVRRQAGVTTDTGDAKGRLQQIANRIADIFRR